MGTSIHRRARALVAGGIALVLAGGMLAAATTSAEAAPAPAPAQAKAKVSSWSFYGSTKVKTSKGKKLTVTVNGSASSSYGSMSAGFTNGTESHSWNFPGSKKTVKQTSKLLGKISLAKGKTKNYVGIALTAKSAGKVKANKCQGKVYSKMRKVVLTGKLLVDTKAGWGKINKSGFRVPGTAYRYFSVNCDYGNGSCYESTSWNIYNNTSTAYTSMGGSTYGKRSSAYASRSTEIKGVKDGRRYDYVSAGKVKKADLNAGDNKIKVFIGKTTGTLATSSDPSTNTYKCAKKKNTKSTSWYGATLTNGSKPLKLNAQIYGDFKFANGASGSFSTAKTVSASRAVVSGRELVRLAQGR